MATTKRLGAGKAKTAMSHQKSKTLQKPYQGKAQPHKASKRATTSASGPIKGTAGVVAKHAAAQKNFMGGMPGVTKLSASGQTRQQQFQGPSSSHAEVSRTTPKRMNLTTFRDLFRSGGAKAGKPVYGYNQPSVPADMFGQTRTANKSALHKSSVKTPTAGGPKVQTTNRAFKGAGVKPAVIRGSRIK